MDGYAACMEDERDAYRILVGKSEERRPLGRPRIYKSSD
jgi:hypothetical protein